VGVMGYLKITGYVAIPYSSGTSFLPKSIHDVSWSEFVSRNPLFIRDKFPTSPCMEEWISPLPCRNPLFIRDKFPTARICKRRRIEERSQSLIHQGQVSYLLDLAFRSVYGRLSQSLIHQGQVSYARSMHKENRKKLTVAIPYSSGTSFLP